MTALPLDSIKIGSRSRQDHGDIAALARSIEEIGLLHPIVIKPDRTLIAGERRLMAFEQLGRETIPVTVVDLEKIVLGEYAENKFRKNFTPSECADIADALEPVERTLAKERMVAAHASPGKFPELVNGNALDKVAKAAGKDRKTIQKARAVRDAAKAEPEKFGKLQADMDRTGRVDGPFKRIKVMRQSEAIRKSRRRFRNEAPIASSWPTRRGLMKCGKKTLRIAVCTHTQRCRLSKFAPSMFRLSRILIAFSGFGPPIITCGRRSLFSMLGGLSRKRFLHGQKTRWALATGCAARPSTASWPFEAGRSSS
jgi:ParB-like chromosome segregation protein Spo0J